MKASALSLIVLSAIYSGSPVAAQPLYRTSFEKEPSGNISKFGDPNSVSWNAMGKAEITKKFSKTGLQSLHIHGETKQIYTLDISGDTQNARGISFWAERWSNKGAFDFRIEGTIDGSTKELIDLSQLIEAGKRFRSHIKLAIPGEGKISQLKFILSSEKGVLIDDFQLLAEAPKNPTTPPLPVITPTEPLGLLASTEVFTAGDDNCHTYRIPSIITAPNGDLLAACDARWKSAADLIHVRDIDIVIKRSTDNGKTWGPMETVVDYPEGTGGTDPSMVLDHITGEIFIFYSYMGKKSEGKEFFFRVQCSKDNGKTWSKPRDITKDISKPEWKNSFKFISSGRGSQMEDGTLIHNFVVLGHGAKVFGSKDHGKTWKLMDSEIKPANESRVLELTDGRLMVNSRHNGNGSRAVHLSEDGGKIWNSRKETQLPDPGCNGAILRYTSKKDGYSKDRLLFSNAGSVKGRKNLSIRISYDEGQTWSAGKVVTTGPAAYSEITILKDGSIGVLFEPGYKSIRFVRFTVEELTDGKDKLSKAYKIK